MITLDLISLTIPVNPAIILLSYFGLVAAIIGVSLLINRCR